MRGAERVSDGCDSIVIRKSRNWDWNDAWLKISAIINRGCESIVWIFGQTSGNANGRHKISFHTQQSSLFIHNSQVSSKGRHIQLSRPCTSLGISSNFTLFWLLTHPITVPFFVIAKKRKPRNQNGDVLACRRTTAGFAVFDHIATHV